MDTRVEAEKKNNECERGPYSEPLARAPSSLVPTVFHEDWWLKICSDDDYEKVTVEHNGRTIASLAYVRVRRHGFRFCAMPPLVHMAGPVFAPLQGPPATQLQNRHELTRQLLTQLPPFDVFDQKMHHEVADTLPFQRAGFATTVQFTFEIAPAPAKQIFANLRRGHRRMIRDAEAQDVIDLTSDPVAFVDAYAANIQSSGRRFGYDKTMIVRLIEESRSRSQGELLVARDVSGRLRAGLFVVWDHQRMYNFLATRDARGVDSRSSVYLVWRAIEMACHRNLVFDFDGVFNVGQVQYFAGFGGTTSPRYIVRKLSKVANVANALRQLVHVNERIY